MYILDYFKIMFFWLTVMIGSRGPKISSVMTSESRGGSTKMVGSNVLYMQKQKEKKEAKLKILLLHATPNSKIIFFRRQEHAIFS